MTVFEATWLNGADQTSQAAGVAARALRDNPTSLAVSEDPLVRLEMCYSAFGHMLAASQVSGVRRGECVLAVAAAERPDHCIASMIPPELRALDPPDPEASDAERFLHLGSVMADHDLPEPHWHVGPVGVEPGFQGMGMGRTAMSYLCDEFDTHGRVAWLETDKPENVRFYIGLGFEVADEVPILSVPNWFMRRDPR
jgi:ribosomal protein S18 acetylase RimI-like enzyme